MYIYIYIYICNGVCFFFSLSVDGSPVWLQGLQGSSSSCDCGVSGQGTAATEPTRTLTHTISQSKPLLTPTHNHAQNTIMHVACACACSCACVMSGGTCLIGVCVMVCVMGCVMVCVCVCVLVLFVTCRTMALSKGSCRKAGLLVPNRSGRRTTCSEHCPSSPELT